MDEDTKDIKDIAYELYQALDGIMWRANHLPSGERVPAEEAMKAYEEWDKAREEEYKAFRAKAGYASE